MDSENNERRSGQDRRAGADRRKRSVYLPEEIQVQIEHEADRQKRTFSWILQQAWRIARPEIRKMPSINLHNESDDESSESKT